MVTACVTRSKLNENISVCNLILPVPDTDFSDFLKEVAQLAKFVPEIIAWFFTLHEIVFNVRVRHKKKLRHMACGIPSK